MASARHPPTLSERGWARLHGALSPLRSAAVAVGDAAEVPQPVARARWRPSARTVLALGLVLLLAAGVLGLRFWWAVRASADPPTVPRPVATVPVGVTAHSGGAGSPSVGGAGIPRASGALLVHVVGQVRRPGVVSVPAGGRVEDAVRLAWGPTSAADLSLINLARPLVDGEQVRVLAKGEALTSAATGPVGPGGSGGSAGAPGGRVSLNSADAGALDSLPGVGPVLAARILAWRTEHGRFTSVEELGEVSGIGDRLLSQLRPLVTL